MWANELANANGILMEDEEDAAAPPLPEAGWLRDSVDGAVWMEEDGGIMLVPPSFLRARK